MDSAISGELPVLLRFTQEHSVSAMTQVYNIVLVSLIGVYPSSGLSGWTRMEAA